MKCLPFKAGDIAIFQNLPMPFSFLNGSECEVLESLREHHIECLNGNHDVLPVYKVRIRAGVVGVLPEQLRHKKPPESSDSERKEEPICAEK